MASAIKVEVVPMDTEASLGINSNRRSLRYIILFNAAVYDSDEVLLVSGAPYVGFQYPWNDSLRCHDVAVEATDNAAIWYIDAEFSADTLIVEEGYGYDFSPAPIIREVAVRSAYWYDNPIKTEEEGEVERHTSPLYTIETSIGNPPAEPIMGVEINTQFSWWQIETRAMSGMIETGDIYGYIGSINEKSITICGQTFNPHEVELKMIAPEIYAYRPPDSIKSERRYKVTYTVEKPLNNCNARMLDQDYQAWLDKRRAMSPGEGTASQIKRNIRIADLPENAGKISLFDEHDEDVSDPVKLDGNGRVLGIDGSPVYIQFQHKPSFDWATVFNFAARQKV